MWGRPGISVSVANDIRLCCQIRTAYSTIASNSSKSASSSPLLGISVAFSLPLGVLVCPGISAACPLVFCLLFTFLLRVTVVLSGWLVSRKRLCFGPSVRVLIGSRSCLLSDPLAGVPSSSSEDANLGRARLIGFFSFRTDALEDPVAAVELTS